jgi:hypothetical protein
MAEGEACDDGDSCTIDGECDANGDCISIDIETIACVDDTPCGPGNCNTGSGLCECVPCEASEPALAEPTVVAKNRYFSFTAGDPGRSQAIQVSFVSLPGYEYAEGRSMWVQEPFPVTESSGSDAAVPLPTYTTAELGCTPAYVDWSAYGVIDVYDDAIIPGATVQLRVLGQGCDTAGLQHYSLPLAVSMSQVGDVAGDCAPDPCTPPQGVVDFVDISAVVEKFKNEPAAPRKARTDLAHSTFESPVPDRKVDFVDISFAVDAFRSQALPLSGPPADDPCS